MVVRGELKTCDISKMVLFRENTLPFKVVNDFEKKLHFKIYYVVLVFFEIYIYYRPFFFF